MKQTPLKVKNPLRGIAGLPRTKQIKARGAFGMQYLEWRDKVAIPYLKANFDTVCAQGCGERARLDVGHIKPRSTNPELRMDLNNVEYQCVPFNRFGACNK